VVFDQLCCSGGPTGHSSPTASTNSARATIRPDELLGFKRLAAEMLGYDDAALAKAVAGGALEEVSSDEQDLSE
jgi:hypothetical protein